VAEPREPSLGAEPAKRPDPDLALTHLDRLPTLSSVAIRLLAVTADPRSSVADAVEILQADQSLTAKVLSVASSAWAGVRGPVHTLEKAVPLLGFATLRSVVLAVSVFECLPTQRGREDRAFDPREFWKHSLAVACAARGLAAARRALGVDPQEAFVAGLLHDLGKVALSAIFPKAYERIAAEANQARGDIADFERDLLGTDHTVAGRRVAERWRLPRLLREAIWLHHLALDALPASIANQQALGLVLLADTLAREQRIGYSGNHVFYEHSARLAQRLGLTDTQLADVIARLVNEVVELTNVLGLEHETADAVYSQAMSRANAELGRLNTELTLAGNRLAAGARYFRALSQFDRVLGAWSDLPNVVAAIAEAAGIALQRPAVAAFGLREQLAGADVCWIGGGQDAAAAVSVELPAEVQDWLASPDDVLDCLVTRAPPAIRPLLAPALQAISGATAWLIPILHQGRLAGGIVYASETDERQRLAGEADELRSFTACLGLALGRANAQAAARRLADDLAETNRNLQQAQAELLRSRTLSMIAEMAAGAGHELNSPLTVISGRAQMLAKQFDDPDARRSLETISHKAHECSRLVSELMDFARPRPPKLAVVNVPELLAELRAAWLARWKLPDERLVLEVHREGPGVPASPSSGLEIRADHEQLRTVLDELVTNAQDAGCDSEGAIQVICRPAATGCGVEVIVRDNGSGMTPQVLQRAFDPFFSQRKTGRGRGLGLPRAFRIVEGHRGRIWLESRPGEGTNAHVVLPAVPPQAACPDARPTADAGHAEPRPSGVSSPLPDS
jgi:putative nucleotidyltransferase with HDIG domain